MLKTTMTNKKYKPKIARRIARRSIRRDLDNINPSNVHDQTQSPLFSKLPAELRAQVFEYAIIRQRDPVREGIPNPSGLPEWVSDYEVITETSTTVLRTCKLIYYETYVIPLRGTIHCNEDLKKQYPFHLSSQQGKHVVHYHLVTHITSSRHPIVPLTRVLSIPHLHWRKLNRRLGVTRYASGVVDSMDGKFRKIPSFFSRLRFPSSMLEVVVAVEDYYTDKILERFVRGFRQTKSLQKVDGEFLNIDEEGCECFIWHDGGASMSTIELQKRARGRLVRTCWRAEDWVHKRRDLQKYDHLRCWEHEHTTEADRRLVQDALRRGRELQW